MRGSLVMGVEKLPSPGCSVFHKPCSTGTSTSCAAPRTQGLEGSVAVEPSTIKLTGIFPTLVTTMELIETVELKRTSRAPKLNAPVDRDSCILRRSSAVKLGTPFQFR